MRPGSLSVRVLGVVLAATCALAPAPVAAARALAFRHVAPTVAPPTSALRLTGEVPGSGDVERVTLHFRLDDGPWRERGLVPATGERWSAELAPAELRGRVLTYWIEARDFFGGRQAAFASATRPARVVLQAGAAAVASTLPTPGAPVVTLAESPSDPVESAPSAPVAVDAPRPGTGALRVLVLEREEIRAFGLRTLADVLKLLPGFDTSRDVQGFWRVASRGRRVEAEVRVEWDGLPLANPYDGRTNWELPVELLERVEVRRGPWRAGEGGFGAVVRLLPRTAPGVDAQVIGGSFGAGEARTRGTIDAGGWRLGADVDVARRDGYVEAVTRDVVTNDPDRDAGVTDDHRSAITGGVLAQRVFGDGLPTLQARVRGVAEERGALVGAWDAVAPGASLGWAQVTGDVGLTLERDGWSLDTRVFGGRHATERLFVLRDPARLADARFPSGIRERTTIGEWSAGGRATVGRVLGGHRLVGGLVGELQRIDTYAQQLNVNGVEPVEGDTFVTPRGAEFPQKDPLRNGRFTGAAFLEDEWRLVDALLLVAGARVEHVSDAGLAVLPRVALAWTPVETVVARLAFSRAFRPPTFEELYTRSVLVAQLGIEQAPGSMTLKPVYVTSAEASLEAAGALGDGTGRAQLAAFWDEYDDPIDLVPSGSAPARVNRDGVRVLGLEAGGTYGFARGRGRAFANVSWQRAIDLEQAAIAPAFAHLTEVPQLRSNVGVTVPIGDWCTVSFLGQFGSERRQNARTPIEATRRFRLPAYGLLSTVLRTAPLFDRFEAALSVHNFTDVDLRDDVPRPDRMSQLLPREGVSAFLSLRAAL